jgi:hypothetical protein
MKARLLQLVVAGFVFLAMDSSAAMLYVDLNSASPASPYTNWATAAHNIQDAVAVTQPGDTVLVTNGWYNLGGAVVYGSSFNRVALTNAILLSSVNGPQVTRIVGGTEIRGVYVGSNAVLSGFTVTNCQARLSGNYTNEMSGGGIWCEPSGVVTNCVIGRNSAHANYGLGGGMFGGVALGCAFITNTAAAGGGACNSTLVNCLVANNRAVGGGGGASGSVLYNCTLTGNQGTERGGGAYGSALYNCTLSANSCGSYNGGGAGFSTLYSCKVTGNYSVGHGGGTYESTNYNCVLAGNIAQYYGGGAYGGNLYNCTVVGNVSSNSYGGVYGGVVSPISTLINCIVYSNSAPSDPNWSGGRFSYCCTTPLPDGSGNITSAPSLVDIAGGDYRLKCGSPCIDAGLTNSPVPVITNDIRGLPRPLDGNGDGIAKFDLGAYEYDPIVDSVPAIRAIFSFTNFTTHYPVSFIGQVGACADYFWWDFGDGVTMTNQFNASHAWTSPGTFDVQLTAYYSNLGLALSATTSVQVVERPVYYVNIANTMPVAPYTSWATAATNIQQAVGAGTTPGRLVLVTNGLYVSTGVRVFGVIYNTVALTNAVVVQSVSGAQETVIRPSYSDGRCCYAGSNAILSGFTLTGGGTMSGGDTNKELSGGGIWCEPGAVVSNCVIAGNSAKCNAGGAFQGTFYNCVISNNVGSGFYDGQGGGVYGGTLYNCLVISNWAWSQCYGGGVYQSTLYNCALIGNQGNHGGGAAASSLYGCFLSGNVGGTGYGGGGYASTLQNCVLTGNDAYYGGGTYNCTSYNCTIVGNSAPVSGGGIWGGSLTNCIVYFNTASSGSNWSSGTLRWSCTSPLPTGPGNITNEPVFINRAAGDLRLHFGSPGIDAGTNLSAYITNDIDGNPRPLDGNGDGVAKFDMGAYEFNLVATVGTNWLLGYGLDPNDPLVFQSHPNGHPLTVLQSWIADINPTNPESLFLILAVSNGPPVTVSFSNSASRAYTLFANTNPAPGWLPVAGQVNVPGNGGVMVLQDTNTHPLNFYRVGVSIP